MEKRVKKPDFFIVGAPRSGTTAMYTYLKQHPEIFMPETTKEPHFFCIDFESPLYIRDISKYLSLFDNAKNEKRIGEASATYLYSKRAAEEIKAFCPSARIIIMLRNPIDMLYSLHSQFLYDGVEDITDFETALAAESDRKRGLRIPASKYPSEFLFYREFARYTVQVKRYLDTLGKENVHTILFDDFKNDTPKIYKETLLFLDVNEDFQPDFSIINPNKQVRNRMFHNFLVSPPYLIQQITKILIPGTIRQKVSNILLSMSINYEPRHPIKTELKHSLYKEFEQEIESLGRLIERDLYNWITS